MTLVVSARVPDGVVVGADSLATLGIEPAGKAQGMATCPECGKEHSVELDVALPQGLATVSTLPYSMKLVPMFGRAAVATFGSGMIERRTVFSLLMEFQDKNDFGSLPAMANELGGYLHRHLAGSTNVADIPEGKHALGFHASGYDGGEPKTFVVNIGRDVALEEWGDFGVTVSGESAVVTQLWKLRETDPKMSSSYGAWSVLDAADYVRFCIRTTADYQRFVTMVPTVGGDVDVAVVTRQEKFSWISKKALADLLLSPSIGGGDDE